MSGCLTSCSIFLGHHKNQDFSHFFVGWLLFQVKALVVELETVWQLHEKLFQLHQFQSWEEISGVMMGIPSLVLFHEDF